MSRLTELIHEIHRRSLWQVLGIYLVGAWVAFQGIESLVSGLGLPDWVPGFALVLLIIGLPVVLATASVQEGVGPPPAAGEARGSAGGESARTEAPALRRIFTWRNAILGGASAFALWGIVITGWLLSAGGIPGEPADRPAIQSMAVLPLANLSGDPDQEYFTDGMTELLITELSRLPGLRVISRTSVMRYKNTTELLPEIARTLNVDAIIEGSVLRAGDRVRVTAQLIDARSDEHLWAESYDRDLRDVLTLQREIALAVSSEVGARVGNGSPTAQKPARPVNPESHQAYLKARFLVQKHSWDASLQSIPYFEEAIRLDPSYALPHAGLADAYSCTPTHAWSVPDSPLWPSVPQALMARARASALQALHLDDQLATAHTSLGLVKVFGDWDWSGAEQDFRRAIELDPSDSWARQTYAMLLSLTGRLDEALVELTRAYQRDPLSPYVVVMLGDLHYWRGEIAEARARWDEALEFNAGYLVLHNSMVPVSCRDGAPGEMIAILERASAGAPDDPVVTADLGYCYAVAGRHDEARALLRRLEELGDRTYVSPMSPAMVHAGLDDVDAAFEALEQAYRDRAFFLPYVGLDAPYETLRSDPRFAELLGRLDLPLKGSQLAASAGE